MKLNFNRSQPSGGGLYCHLGVTSELNCGIKAKQELALLWRPCAQYPMKGEENEVPCIQDLAVLRKEEPEPSISFASALKLLAFPLKLPEVFLNSLLPKMKFAHTFNNVHQQKNKNTAHQSQN